MIPDGKNLVAGGMVWELSFYLPENVCVRAGIQHQQHQFFIVLFPDQQPVGLNVAFPFAFVVTSQDMSLVLRVERLAT